MDNTPVYDEAINRIPYQDIQMDRLETDVVEPDHRPSREYYKKCLSLIQTFSDKGYDWHEIRNTGEFVIEHVLFNSLWCQANQCLSQILEALGENSSLYREWAQDTKVSIRSELRQRGDLLQQRHH